MARGRKSKQHKIGYANYSANKEKRIKKEIKKTEKKMEKLLRLFKEGRPRKCKDKVKTIQGIVNGSKRHNNLKNHISSLKGKL